MLTLPASVRVFVARGATDLRRSFDRLSAQAQEVLHQDPLSGHVFAFFNRRRDRVKLLVWERTDSGYCTSGWRPAPSRCWTAMRSTLASCTC
jgi:transposase